MHYAKEEDISNILVTAMSDSQSSSVTDNTLTWQGDPQMQGAGMRSAAFLLHRHRGPQQIELHDEVAIKRSQHAVSGVESRKEPALLF